MKSVQVPNINAMLVGCISSSKSSFINGSVGGVVQSSGKDRETFEPFTFHLNKDGVFANICQISKKINEQKLKNKELFKNTKLEENKISSINQSYAELELPAMFNAYITDFAGMGDERDTDNMIYKAVLNNIPNFNLVIFVCDANKPFLQKEEVNFFNGIKEEIKKQYNENQIFVELIVVVGKYDDPEDIELNEMFNAISKTICMPKEKIFRVSAFQMFIYNMGTYLYLPSACQQEYKNIQKYFYGRKVPKELPELDTVVKSDEFIKTNNPESGDWDNIAGFINKLDEEIIEKLAKPRVDRVISMLDDVDKWKSLTNPMKYYTILKFLGLAEITYDHVKIGEQYNYILQSLTNEYYVYSNYNQDKLRWCWNFTDEFIGEDTNIYSLIYEKYNRLFLPSVIIVHILEKLDKDKRFDKLKEKCLNYDKIVSFIKMKDNNYIIDIKKHVDIIDSKFSGTTQYNILKSNIVNFCQKTDNIELLAFFKKYTYENSEKTYDEKVLLNVHNLLQPYNKEKYTFLRVYILFFTMEQSYKLLSSYLKSGDSKNVITDIREDFKEFRCEFKVFNTSLRLLRILQFNNKLDEYIEGLYTETSKNIVKLFVSDPSNTKLDETIGSVLFSEHYYLDCDSEVENCEIKNLIY